MDEYQDSEAQATATSSAVGVDDQIIVRLLHTVDQVLPKLEDMSLQMLGLRAKPELQYRVAECRERLQAIVDTLDGAMGEGVERGASHVGSASHIQNVTLNELTQPPSARSQTPEHSFASVSRNSRKRSMAGIMAPSPEKDTGKRHKSYATM
jgi:hypothetical protein